MSTAAEPYKRHRFPVEIISHCVWLNFRFSLSYRNVEELILERATGRSLNVAPYLAYLEEKCRDLYTL